MDSFWHFSLLDRTHRQLTQVAEAMRVRGVYPVTHAIIPLY